jgi:hypothetical protein
MTGTSPTSSRDPLNVVLREALRLTGKKPATSGSLSCMKLADLRDATRQMIAEGDKVRIDLLRVVSTVWFTHNCLPIIVPSVPLDTWDFCQNDTGPWGRTAIWTDGEMRYGESGPLMYAQVFRFGSCKIRKLEFVAIGQPFTETSARMQLVDDFGDGTHKVLANLEVTWLPPEWSWWRPGETKICAVAKRGMIVPPMAPGAGIGH